MNSDERQNKYLIRNMAIKGYLMNAFKSCFIMFSNYPNSRLSFEIEFRSLLGKLNTQLARRKKVKEVVSNLERALKAYPDNIYFLIEIGKYYFKFKMYSDACLQYQKTLRIHPASVLAEKNLNVVKNVVVEPSCFRLLNDRSRNEAYENAIDSIMVPRRHSVLVLNSGPGLSAMFASRQDPIATTACDTSLIMLEIAQEAMYYNDVNMVVLIGREEISSMNYRDIGGKRSLVILELFDEIIFGKGTLQTITHAFENFISAVGRLIPSRAEYFIVGAYSPSLVQRYQLGDSVKRFLNIVQTPVHADIFNSHDADDVHLESDITCMTEPDRLFQVDFNDFDDVDNVLNNSNPRRVDLKMKHDGEINCIIGFLNLYLSEDIHITTNPFSEDRANAWKQAIFFDFIPEKKEKDDFVSLRFVTAREKIIMQVEPHKNTRISPEMLRFLNDVDYINMITENSEIMMKNLHNIKSENVHVADLSPFPLLGMILLKLGAQFLFCVAKDRLDKSFIERVFNTNGIELVKVNIVLEETLQKESFANKKFHVIFRRLIDLNGEVNTKHKKISDYAEAHSLHEGGLVLPHKIILQGVCINSNWLDINNRVDDDNINEFKIGSYINKYRVTENVGVKYAHLENADIMSQEVCFGEIGRMQRTDFINVAVIRDGNANAVLCWYSIYLLENNTTFVSTRRSNSFSDGVVFLSHPAFEVRINDIIGIMRCGDPDGSYKITTVIAPPPQQ